MIMQVHDELVFEVAEVQTEQLQQAVLGFMCGAAQLSVPLEVESDFGANWDEAH
jgi:DNA polymerase-1